MRPRSGAVGGSVHAPGVRAYFAHPENLPFNFTDPERDEPIVVETWWLPKDVQSRLWRIPINEYGFVRAPSLAALREGARGRRRDLHLRRQRRSGRVVSAGGVWEDGRPGVGGGPLPPLLSDGLHVLADGGAGDAERLALASSLPTGRPIVSSPCNSCSTGAAAESGPDRTPGVINERHVIP
jgi:hypothetical protein